MPGARVQTITAADGVPLTVWTAPARADRPTILYLMGNAGALPSAGPRLEELVLAGYGLVALNYRGAGGTPGAPSQAALVSDALTVYDALTGGPADPPVIYGTSLGAALAVQTAAQRRSKALILETPFTRLCDTAHDHFPGVPHCLLLWDEEWASIDLIAGIDAPLLVLHGDADRIVPITHGRRLFDAAVEPKTFVTFPGGRHNDLRLHGAGIEIIRFLEALPAR